MITKSNQTNTYCGPAWHENQIDEDFINTVLEDDEDDPKYETLLTNLEALSDKYEDLLEERREEQTSRKKWQSAIENILWSFGFILFAIVFDHFWG